MQPTSNFADLIALMARLRQDCPWDKNKPTTAAHSLRLEETYELVEAIQSGDIDDIKGWAWRCAATSGFHACLYEQQQFDISGDFHLATKNSFAVTRMCSTKKIWKPMRCQKRWDEIKALENAEKKAKQG